MIGCKGMMETTKRIRDRWVWNKKNQFIIKACDIFKISSQRKEYKRKRNREKKMKT